MENMPRNKIAFSLKLIIGFPLVGIFWTIIIYFINDSHSFHFNIAYWIGGTGIILGLLCLISTYIFNLVWKFWHKLIFILDIIITWITLPIFYYLIFSPFALLLRAFGMAQMKNPARRKSSFWKDAEQPNSAKQYLRQF